MQWAGAAAGAAHGVGLARVAEGLLGIEVRPSADLTVAGGDAVEAGGDESLARNFAAADGVGRRRDGQCVELGHAGPGPADQVDFQRHEAAMPSLSATAVPSPMALVFFGTQVGDLWP